MRERMKFAREQSGKNKQKREEKKAQDKKYKQLMEQKKLLEMEEIEKKIEQKKNPKPKAEPEPNIKIVNSGLSEEQIKKMQFDAILQYDTLRKKRKEKKKQEQQVKQYNEDVKNNLKKELGWRDISGIYADCF